MANIPIFALIDEIEAMRSEKSGRFTAGEIEILENTLEILKDLERLPTDQRKEAMILIMVQLLRFFLNHDVLREMGHFLKF